MKKIILLIVLAFLSFNLLAKSFEGGYIDGEWYAFYNNTYRERSCIQEELNEHGKCLYYSDVYIDDLKLTVIGIAEVKREYKDEYGKKVEMTNVLLKVSDFKLKLESSLFEDETIYTPNNYPVSPKNKAKPYFPRFIFYEKSRLLSYLKSKDKNLRFNGKEWIEEYEGKKVKFLGVDTINLDLGSGFGYGLIDQKGEEIGL